MSSQVENHTQKLILDTAVSLLNTHGDLFTINQLASQTRLSRATIYRHMGSKEALLQRLADERNMDIQALSQPDIQERILAAARTVFSRYGMLRPTMEQIAEEAGVGIATVYRHFGDRASLIEAFTKRITPNAALEQEILNSSADFEHTLGKMVETIVSFMYQHRDIFRHTISSYEDESSIFQQVRLFQEQNLRLMTKFLQKQIEAGHLKPADPTELSFALVGIMFAFTIVRPTFYEVPVTNPAKTAKFVVDLFLTGTKVQPDH